METNNSTPNRVAQMFADKTILITGATGFIGKVLVEKLLRSCSNLRKIYVITRAKKGQTPHERIMNMFKLPLYDLVRKEQGDDIFAKVEAISGDVCTPDLALSPEDRKKLSEETEFIYHSAATIRFDEPFKHTILLNVRGTKLMLDLAKECKQLQFFSYVSSAYCHDEQEVLREEFYPPPADPHRILELCELLDDNTIEKISKTLRDGSVNNYSFSKALAEALVEEQKNYLPVTIHRPSAVVPAMREPIPGWCDNLNGPIGLCVAVAAGVLRTMYAREDILIDAIPVDVAVNAIIITTYIYFVEGDQPVFNVIGSHEAEKFALTAKKILKSGIDIIDQIPFSLVLWRPRVTLTQSRLYNCLNFILFQLLPALLIDTILLIIGLKPFLLKVQKRIWRGYQVFEYYANREWRFDCSKTANRQNRLLNSVEKAVFKTTGEDFDVNTYLYHCALGSRRYIMKDPDENIPMALKKMKILRGLDQFSKILLTVAVTFYLYKWVFC